MRVKKKTIDFDCKIKLKINKILTNKWRNKIKIKN